MNKQFNNIEHQLIINPEFAAFINDDVLPLTSVDQETFWSQLSQLFSDFQEKNDALFHSHSSMKMANNGQCTEEHHITEAKLVAPIINTLSVLNAANARWSSLYDHLYGSEMTPATNEQKDDYDHTLGQQVIAQGRDFLDKMFPLTQGSHHDVTTYHIYYQNFCAILNNGQFVGLQSSPQFVGYNGCKEKPDALLLKHNDLHVEIQIDPQSFIGKNDAAHVENIKVESALITIMDCEHMGAETSDTDKITIYKNWLGLMRGDLETSFEKNGKRITHRLKKDRTYIDRNSDQDDELYYTVPARNPLWIRNTCGLSDTDLILDRAGNKMPERILDQVVTALIALIDNRQSTAYLMKHETHGPADVALTCELFDRVEDLLSVQRNTLKLGIMGTPERANGENNEDSKSTALQECLSVARDRAILMNAHTL